MISIYLASGSLSLPQNNGWLSSVENWEETGPRFSSSSSTYTDQHGLAQNRHILMSPWIKRIIDKFLNWKVFSWNFMELCPKWAWQIEKEWEGAESGLSWALTQLRNVTLALFLLHIKNQRKWNEHRTGIVLQENNTCFIVYLVHNLFGNF